VWLTAGFLYPKRRLPEEFSNIETLTDLFNASGLTSLLDLERDITVNLNRLRNYVVLQCGDISSLVHEGGIINGSR
jgi:hypothetical protein